MTRFSASENEDAASGVHVAYVLFADFDFASGNVRLCTFSRDLTFGGFTYTAVGKLANIGPVRESADLSPDKLEFTLAGDTAALALALTEQYHGRDAMLHIGFLDASDQLVATPHLLWEGRMDTMGIRSQKNGSVISLVCENRLVLWNRASGWLLTDEHQEELAPGDRILDLVHTLMNKVVKWNKSKVSSGRSGGGGRRGRGPREQ
jgi:hypothetical protein